MGRPTPFLTAILVIFCVMQTAHAQILPSLGVSDPVWTTLNSKGTAKIDYYIGVPNYKSYVKLPARFVLDPLPWNMNGRLYEGNMPRYLEPLKKFLDEHPGHKCNFLLYSCESNEEQNLRFTTYQSERLSDYFTYVDTAFGQKYLNKIIPHSDFNPLFQNLQPDSSEGIYEGSMIVYRSCVLVELVKEKPINNLMAQVTAFYARPSDACDCDIAPVYPGGMEGLYNFLAQRMDYSVVGPADVIGVVLVEFDIEPDGSVANAELKNSLFTALDEQALHIVKEMPRWQPAFKDGSPVRCRYLIPFRYFL